MEKRNTWLFILVALLVLLAAVCVFLALRGDSLAGSNVYFVRNGANV